MFVTQCNIILSRQHARIAACMCYYFINNLDWIDEKLDDLLKSS